MPDASISPSEPSLVQSVIRVVEAGHQLVLDRLDLARYDVAELGTRTLRGAALIAVGAVLLAGAWFAAMAVLVIWMQAFMSLAAAVGIIGAASAMVGVGAITSGIGRTRQAVERFASTVQLPVEPARETTPANGARQL